MRTKVHLVQMLFIVRSVRNFAFVLRIALHIRMQQNLDNSSPVMSQTQDDHGFMLGTR